jgi:hypothetical protein|tara:strand:- start:289 stop:1074 length:786 start_codon:yes stop_codon:yes gene_type:complete
MAIALVGVIESLTTEARKTHTQDSAPGAPSSQPQQSPLQEAPLNTNTNARLVPLYPVGDLYVEQTQDPPRPPIQPSPDKKQEPAVTEIEPLDVSSREHDGDRPILEVGYEEIGFSRYLDIIERVGRFFILIRRGEERGIGPQVSLRNGKIYRRKGGLDSMATGRPHLVSDVRIHDSLRTIDLPDDALDDRVVLLLTEPFDNLLWDIIDETIASHGLGLSKVALVRGTYVENESGVFLCLDSAVEKASGNEITLNRKLRIYL